MAKDKDRVSLATCVGKIMAYIKVNKQDDAKAWARTLVGELQRLGLL